ncbi:MAG TPA: FAD-linked oxidase, partial [Actinomycetota bacterium]|nr:FAD-linked oxidase [Actinomycetota bacterium]
MAFPSSPSISIPRLRGVFDGRVIAPGDAGYDQARAVFYKAIDRRPAVIVRPAGTAEVAQVVTL